MLLTDFIRALEQIVPLSAVGYERDAVGLQVGLPERTELTAALFAYEVTEKVIAEAKTRGANLIVAFHPLIFPSIPAITDRTRTGLLLRELVKNDIALYIQHTAFDTHPEFGTSRLMAEALNLTDIRLLSPLKSDQRYGMGAIGRLSSPVPSQDLLSLISKTFKTPALRYNERTPKTIETVAVLGGAGMDFYSSAVLQKADAFITADIRYHDFHRADHDKILLIDVGHAETERFVTQGMVRAAKTAITAPGAHIVVNLQTSILERLLLLAQTEPNAVHYYHDR